MIVKTVKIVCPVTDDNPHGHIVINAIDLTEDHELVECEDDGKPKRGRPRKVQTDETTVEE